MIKYYFIYNKQMKYIMYKIVCKAPMIDKILNVNSRWVLINLVNPVYVLHAKGAFII